jgi:hypothetical protein
MPLVVGAAAAGLGVAFLEAPALVEGWLLVFVILAGLAAGSLGVLMIGHFLGDEWLEPVRAELEAAALTVPLIALLAVPLALRLDDLFPWAAGGPGAAELPDLRAAYLQPVFVLARLAVCLVVWGGLAVLIARPGRHRVLSGIGLALLAPTVTAFAIDWVMSREPAFWSTIFGFAFSLNQLVAALAGAIFVSLVRFEHPSPERMQSLEKGLLTLTLLTLWTWFVQFLVIWMGNLPDEAAWYVERRDWLWLMVGVTLPALFLAIAVLIPPGAGRLTMAIGSGLLLVQHAAHMTWLVRPRGWEEGVAWSAILICLGLAAAWLLWFIAGTWGRGHAEQTAGVQEATAREQPA